MPGPSDHLRLTGRRLATYATTATLAGAGILTLAFAHEAGASNPGTSGGDDQAVAAEDAAPVTTATTVAPSTAATKPGTATTRAAAPGQQTTPTAKATPSTRAPSPTLAPPAAAPSSVVKAHSHSGGS